MSLSSTFSTLGLVQLAPVALVTASAVLFILVLIGVYSWVILPIVDWLVGADTGRQQSFLKRVALWPVKKAAAKAQQFMREQIAAMSRWAAASAAPLTLLLLQTAEIVQRIAGTFGDNAEATWSALWKLNHETMPRKIAAALVPIRNVLSNHTGRLDDLEDLNRRVAVEVGDALRALPWGVPGGYVTNIATFLGTYVQLWNHYYDVTRAQLSTLLGETIPEIRRDVADLARRLDVQIDARFDAIAARLQTVEQSIASNVLPRIANLEDALDALAREVFGEVGTGLVALIARVAELEALIADTIAVRLAELEAGLVQLREDLELGIRTGLEAFGERVEALELSVGTLIPQQIEALRLAVEALAAEIFGEVGEGLAALTARIVALEAWVFGELQEQIDLQLGRIEAIEDRIANVILPRLDGIEAILAPVAFAALVLAMMRTVAPNLFCRNVTRTSELLCRADPGFIDDLLAFALGALALTQICELARGIQLAGRGFVGVLGDALGASGNILACGRDDVAEDMALNLTALPSTSSAVAL